MIFYTSDLHLTHKNIIRLCDRPFKDLEDMHKTLIYNWNKKVSNNDTVYILGDLAFARNLELINEAINLINQLNGKKILIKGNHDGKAIRNIDYASLFDDIKIYEDIPDSNKRVIMCHYPIEEWDGRRRGSYHLHGHIHKRVFTTIDNRFNVGVDVNDFEPKTLNELILKECIY